MPACLAIHQPSQYLSKDRADSHLAQVRGLAAHIGSREQHGVRLAAADMNVVGNEIAATERIGDARMPRGRHLFLR